MTAFTAQRSPQYLRDVISAGCYVYGGGGYGRRILQLLREQSIPCAGIIDKKFVVEGGQFDGVPALHPDMVSQENVAEKSLLIGVHNHVVDLSEIIAYGASRGFREVLWNADLPDALGSGADNYWLTNRRFMLAHFVELRDAASRLADRESVETLAALVEYRVTGELAAAPKFKLNEQYAPPGLMQFGRPITFIDGGAYDGDTYRNLLANNVIVSHWIAFEPDPKNFTALTKFACTQPISSTLFPCGLSDCFMQVPFAANEGTSSHLSASGAGEMTVACVALDDVSHGPRPDYIKLDIEGAERAALLGMRKTITAHRPHLAVSLYHRPEDLWVLVQTLVELAPYADLFIRQHCLNAFDTVLYAMPRG